MEQNMVDQIKSDPNFQRLVSERSKFAWKLTIAMLVVYFAFILTIAFNPSVLGTPLGDDSVTTVGIPIGIAVIIFAFALTGIYVKRANTEFDDLTQKIKDKAMGE
ncbi:MAG: DUF485 domain-containing protein [Campylobacterota bacterium]|nr:DUF485 domain-containing protein [Campylobacterota bacterium]